MKRVLLIFGFIFFVLNLSSLKPAYANPNFATDYDATYTVLEDGATHVVFDIALTNKASNYYALSYSVAVGFDDIQNLNASDPVGPLRPLVTKGNEGVNIEVTFNKRVVGINNKQKFNISFTTKDVAKKVGRVWEINIPGLAKQESFENFNVHVKTPHSFGKPAYIKPEIAKPDIDSLSFEKQQLGSSGIYIGFGDFQVYKFGLDYHLKNPNIYKINTEIAIPPSTAYQEIQIEDIAPKPLNVYVDQDGNWLAQYNLAPFEKIDVKVKGKAKVTISPKKQELKKEMIAAYLKEQPYWETSNPDIKILANKLKTPRAIYEYVIDNLKYDFSRVEEGKERLGARNVLKNPDSAVCLEFTDLFIALAKAAGIPAREVDGFAYTERSNDRPLSLVKDVLHAWPEYYDFEKQTWVMVDPTWGNTTKGLDYFNKLDFDRIAFVVKGVNSKYPIPAGLYKLKGQEMLKDIRVGFGDTFEESIPDLLIEKVFSSNKVAGGLPVEENIVIRNVGKTLSVPYEITVASTIFKPPFQKISIDPIPPYGHATYKVKFDPAPILTNKKDIVTIAYNGNSISEAIWIYPIFQDKRFIVGGGILFATCIILSFVAVKTGHIPFFGQKGKSPVRR